MTKTAAPIVLLLTSGLGRGSGGAASAMDIAETLHALGYEVHLALTRSSGMQYALRERRRWPTTIPLERIHAAPPWMQPVLMAPPPVGVLRLRGAALGLAEAALNASRPRRFDEVLAKARLIIDAAALTGASRTIVRGKATGSYILNHAGAVEAFTEHWLTDAYLPADRDPALPPYVQFALQFDRLLFQAPDQAEACARFHPALRDKPVVVRPSCNEREVLAAALTPSPYSEGERALVNVGSLQPRKAQHVSIDVFASLAERFPRLSLHFVGGGTATEYGAQLQRQARDLGLADRIRFHGHRDDYLRFMAHGALLLQTSVAEGVSRVLREAMLMKLPIVSFDISGTAGTLSGGVEAALVPPQDAEAMAAAIARLLEESGTTAAMVRAAHQRYLLNHSWPAYAAAWHALILGDQPHLGACQ